MKAEGVTAAGSTVTRPGSHLPSTGKALDGCQCSPGPDLSAALLAGSLLPPPAAKAHEMPLAGLRSPGPWPRAELRTDFLPFKGQGALWPFLHYVVQSGRAASVRRCQLHLDADTINVSQAICVPVAWSKRDLS